MPDDLSLNNLSPREPVNAPHLAEVLSIPQEIAVCPHCGGSVVAEEHADLFIYCSVDEKAYNDAMRCSSDNETLYELWQQTMPQNHDYAATLWHDVNERVRQWLAKQQCASIEFGQGEQSVQGKELTHV